jgi:hypothetical protein
MAAMSSDERSEKPEFPMRDEGSTDDSSANSSATPPLPEMPVWQAPAAEQASEPATESVAEGERDLTPEPARAVVEETVIVEPVAASSVEQGTREPTGGPYVVTETGAPVAEQAVVAYERAPIGGPYVTSSEATAPDAAEPTPYPTAAFPTGAAVGAAATAAAPPIGGVPYGEYQPVPQPLAAPVPPRPKGNRGGGALIALVGTVAFAVVYAAVAFVIIALNLDGAAAVSAVASFLLTAAFIVPVVVFAISLILIVLIVNRAGWWAYVLGGFFVAVLVYFAGIAGALIHVQAWNWQAQEQYDFVRSLTMDPLTLAGAIVAREVSIWTGAWIAARGRKMKERNLAAREQFERRQAEEPQSLPW